MGDLHKVAGRFDLHCGYAARNHAEAVTYPTWNGLPAIVYVRPWVCREAARYKRKPLTRRQAAALLVLHHEAQHVAGLADEAKAECRALDQLNPKVRRLALPFHQRLVLRFPHYGGPCSAQESP